MSSYKGLYTPVRHDDLGNEGAGEWYAFFLDDECLPGGYRRTKSLGEDFGEAVKRLEAYSGPWIYGHWQAGSDTAHGIGGWR